MSSLFNQSYQSIVPPNNQPTISTNHTNQSMTCFYFLNPPGDGVNIKLKLPHLPRIRYMSCVNVNPTLQMQQRQLAPRLSGAWAGRPDLVPRDPVRWRRPPGGALVSGHRPIPTSSNSNQQNQPTKATPQSRSKTSHLASIALLLATQSLRP